MDSPRGLGGNNGSSSGGGAGSALDAGIGGRRRGRVGVLVAAVAALVLLGCAPEGDGFIEVRGEWADGEAIDFREPARISRADDGRVDLVARSPGVQRFLGARVSFDSTRIKAPGRYTVDPAARGQLEIYCAQPTAAPDPSATQGTLEYEVNEAELQIDRLPGVNGRLFSGTLSAVLLQRQGRPILRLTQGRFEGRATW